MNNPVTKINKAKQYLGSSKAKRKWLKFCKANANRSFRHAAKIAVTQDKDINTKPRLTSWDII